MHTHLKRCFTLIVPCAIVLVLSSLHAGAQSAATAQLPSYMPDAALDATLTPIVEKAIAEGNIPGAVLVVGHNGSIVYRKAMGNRSLVPTREAMTEDTIFDLASLTKCLATTLSVMKLVEEGKLRLNDPVSTYLPEFKQNGKGEVTVRQLLTHYSGLPPDIDLKSHWQGRSAAYELAMQETLNNPPGTRFVYSDINFETLGFIVEKITGQTLADFAAANIYTPLGMKETRFQPPADWIPRIAPTEFDENGHMLRGTVHDPTARRMGGIAGHAGLFSTANDLTLLAEDLLGNSKLLSAFSIEKMSTPQQPATATTLRGFGWDIDSSFSTNRGELLPVGSFGHTGFTGTSLWIDPVTHTYIILLTNAVHPHGGKSTGTLRTKIANAVAASLQLSPSEIDRAHIAGITGYNESMTATRRIATRNGQVKLGIDVLAEEDFKSLHPDTAHPVRVGLVANQTALDSAGHRTIDLLTHQPGLKLAAIFSPEHGVNGVLDTTAIGNSTDAISGVPVYSVYGDSDAARRPSVQVLADLDVIVYDIQDAGVRFYTYETTLGYFLEAAAKTGKEIVVLDRPNLLNGAYVQGPISDAGRESFVDYGQIPVRHGMTIGELARLFNAEKHINAKLTVVPMRGWQRGDWFDSTGVQWVNPSPNLRNMTEAILYPGLGMIEGTNLSVGRGTDTPFEVVGAPWINQNSIDPHKLADALNRRLIPGVRFIPTTFTPTSSIYANQSCGGVSLLLTDREALDAPEMGAEIASTLHALYPNDYQLTALDRLMVNKASFDGLGAGNDPRRIAEDWQDEIDKFMKMRTKYLLY
jgi:uncharacterized protein YbbC (DUF1343 family)/CubicO group peptidase (beta-lactamase class C family)